jgi:hypothetical protein
VIFSSARYAPKGWSETVRKGSGKWQTLLVEGLREEPRGLDWDALMKAAPGRQRESLQRAIRSLHGRDLLYCAWTDSKNNDERVPWRIVRDDRREYGRYVFRVLAAQKLLRRFEYEAVPFSERSEKFHARLLSLRSTLPPLVGACVMEPTTANRRRLHEHLVEMEQRITEMIDHENEIMDAIAATERDKSLHSKDVFNALMLQRDVRALHDNLVRGDLRFPDVLKPVEEEESE